MILALRFRQLLAQRNFRLRQFRLAGCGRLKLLSEICLNLRLVLQLSCVFQGGLMQRGEHVVLLLGARLALQDRLAQRGLCLGMLRQTQLDVQIGLLIVDQCRARTRQVPLERLLFG